MTKKKSKTPTAENVLEILRGKGTKLVWSKPKGYMIDSTYSYGSGSRITCAHASARLGDAMVVIDKYTRYKFEGREGFGRSSDYTTHSYQLRVFDEEGRCILGVSGKEMPELKTLYGRIRDTRSQQRSAKRAKQKSEERKKRASQDESGRLEQLLDLFSKS